MVESSDVIEALRAFQQISSSKQSHAVSPSLIDYLKEKEYIRNLYEGSLYWGIYWIVTPKGYQAIEEYIKEQEAEERAVRDEERAIRAEERAIRAEERAIRAEDRAIRAEAQAIRSEERAVRSEDRAIHAEARADRAEERAIRSEDRAIHAEARADRADRRASWSFIVSILAFLAAIYPTWIAPILRLAFQE